MSGIRCLVVCMLMFAGGRSVHAALLLDHTGGSADPVGADVTTGWTFTVNSNVVIDGLGFFDVNSDGLENSTLVRLWSNDQTLLASTTITDASPLVSSTSTLGDWRFNDISPIFLTPGEYTIGADFVIGLYGTGFTTATTDPSITFNTAVYQLGSGFPSTIDSQANDGVFGPNLRSTAAVPEPSSSLLCGLASVGLGYWSRRRRSRGGRVTP